MEALTKDTNEKSKIGKVKKYRIVIFVSVGAFIACVVLVVLLLQLQTSSKKAVSKLYRTYAKLYPTTDPTLIASSLSFSKYDSAVDVNIDTGVDYISGVQLKIQYDPNVLSNVKVAPGTFFPNGTVLQNDIDTTNGILSYAFVINPGMKGIKGRGQVVTISYTAAPQTATDMVFLPDTKVTSFGINSSVLSTVTNVTVP